MATHHGILTELGKTDQIAFGRVPFGRELRKAFRRVGWRAMPGWMFAAALLHSPKRHYAVANIDFMSEDPHSDRIFVSYTIDFEVARNRKSVSGRTSYGAIIKDIDGEPKVESIKEKVHARSSGSNE